MASELERARRAAVFGRIVPADGWPSVADAGLEPYLARLAADDATRRDHGAILAAVDALVARALDQYGADLPDLAPADLDALVSDAPERDVLVTAAARAYYGDPSGAGAAMLGHRPLPTPPVGSEPALRTTPFAALEEGYDVVVLGAGAGGGVAACVLAEAGARVLLVERGGALGVGDVGRDHLRNHRSGAHGFGTGQPAEPRIVDGNPVERPWDPRWHAGAGLVGGGTRLFQGMAWRFLPDDLRMATRYGVPDGSSLADWPLAWDDLAPHWDWAEWEVGVAGDPTGHRAAGPRRRGYPMPAFPLNEEGRRLAEGAARLGLSTGAVPLLVNSVPRAGRARCVGCGECVGFTCPVAAKNGSAETTIPRALAAGATLVDRTRAVRLDAGGDRVGAVVLLDERTGARRTVRVGHVVVACGAVETARLLLASRGDRHPDGIGNATDQIGRHLQGHVFASVFGRFDDPLDDHDGPGATIATLDLAHGNVAGDGTPLVGGGVVSDELVKLPIVHWAWALPPDAPRWGAAGKAAMRDTYRRTAHLFAQVQEVPRPGNRVRLDPSRVDAAGVPLVHLEGEVHPETRRTAAHLVERMGEWMAASGAGRTWADGVPTGLTAGYHQAGTCRMGADPATSVVDPDGRVHGTANLWVADASVHVTNGSVGPALTVLALARRTAGRLLALA